MSLRTASPLRVTLQPASFAVPDVGTRSDARILMSVVLPAPFGPMRPNMSPASIDSDTSSSAHVEPYILQSRSTLIMVHEDPHQHVRHAPRGGAFDLNGAARLRPRQKHPAP